MIKSVAFEQSTHIQSNALSVLFIVTQQLNQEKVNYYIDLGTLLSMYRDGQLIPWDDDLDLAVNATNFSQAKASLHNP